MEQLTWDLHHDPAMMEGNVMTEYEERFSAKAIRSTRSFCAVKKPPGEITKKALPVLPAPLFFLLPLEDSVYFI